MNRRETKKEARGYTAYLIMVEPEGDYYFSPEGLCIVGEDQSYTVYCLDSRHNYLRAAVLKFPIAQLLQGGTVFRGAQVKLEDLSPFRDQHGLSQASVADLLDAIYRENRERHFYLERFVTTREPLT